MWYVLLMKKLIYFPNPRYFLSYITPSQLEAIRHADEANRREGFVGRYFVVPDEEYESYWEDKIIS